MDVEYQKILDEKESIAKYLNYKENKDSFDSEFLDAFYNTNNFERQMKLFCEYLKTNNYNRKELENVISQKYLDYYDFFGIDGCRANSYKESNLQSKLLCGIESDKLAKVVLDKFKLNERISKKEIKETLKSIYQDLSLSKTAKATDIFDWFEVRACNYMENGKKVNGFELLALKGKA